MDSASKIAKIGNPRLYFDQIRKEKISIENALIFAVVCSLDIENVAFPAVFEQGKLFGSCPTYINSQIIELNGLSLKVTFFLLLVGLLTDVSLRDDS